MFSQFDSCQKHVNSNTCQNYKILMLLQFDSSRNYFIITSTKTIIM